MATIIASRATVAGSGFHLVILRPAAPFNVAYSTGFIKMKKILLASVLAFGAIGASQAASVVANGDFAAGSTSWNHFGQVSIGPVSAYTACCGIDGSGYTQEGTAAFFGSGNVAGGV